MNLLHDGIDRDVAIQKYAAAMAQVDGFDHNKLPISHWELIKGAYEEKAAKLIDLLESMND
jgi:hypothetical protein